MIKTYIIVLNYKVKDEILECIKSLTLSNGFDKDFVVLVVDNNSADGSVEAIKKNFPGIPLIVNQENIGFTGGNNVGIRYALDKGADYILILNPDTIVEKNTVRNLLIEAQKRKVDILGPKIYFYKSKKIWFAGGIMDLDNILGRHRGVDEEDKGQYNKYNETDLVTGAAMLVKREVFNKIGLFDERYFLYLEDLDFCLRAKKAGFKIAYTPEATLYHKNARSTGLGSPLQDYYITRNRLLFAFKFLSWHKRLVLLKHILRTLYFPTRRLAMMDFLIGNFGRGSFR